jgi:hypothetical protein
MLNDIRVRFVPHAQQRYPTVGDWETKPVLAHDGSPVDLVVTVSDTGNWRFNALVAVHELVEALLCASAGIPQEDLDAFDIAFEAARETHEPIRQNCETRELFTFRGAVVDADAEPGDHPDAPYQRQHNFATAVERMMCAAMGIRWADYENAIDALG